MPVADISPYRVPPPTGYSQNTQMYDPNLFVQNQAAQLNALLPSMPAVPEAAPLNVPGGAGAIAATQQGGPWARLLREASKNPDFTPQKFDELAAWYKNSELAPKAALKGMSEQNRDNYLNGFDIQAAKDKITLFGNTPSAATANAQPTEAEQKALDDQGPGVTREILANLLGGTGKLATGLESLLDYGIRRVKGMAGGEFLGVGDETFIGRDARERTASIDAFIRDNTRRRVVREQEEIRNRVQGNSDGGLDTLVAYLGEYLTHPSQYVSQISQLVPGLLAGGGTGRALGTAGAAAKAGTAESVLARAAGAVGNSPVATRVAAASAQGLPATGNQLSAIQDSIARSSLEDLLTDPAAKEIYDQVSQYLPKGEAGETAFKNLYANRLVGRVAPGALLVNTLGGALGAEAALASRLAGNTSRVASTAGRFAAGAAGELGEETLQNTVPQVIENVSRGRAADAGLGEQLGMSLPLAVGLGGGLSLVGNQSQTRRDRSGRRPDASRQTAQGAAQGAANSTATPAAADTQTASVGPWEAPAATALGDEQLSNLSDRLDNKLKTRSTRFKKTVPNLDSPANFIAAAIDETQTLVGDNWSKLSNAQRIDMVEKTVEAMRKRSKLEGIPEAFMAVKQTVLAAKAAEAPAPVRTALDDVKVDDLSQDQIRGLLGGRQQQQPQTTPKAAEQAPQFDEQAYLSRTEPLAASELAALKAVDERIDTANVAPQVARAVLQRTGNIPDDVKSARAGAVLSNTQQTPKRRSGKKEEKAAFQRTDTAPKVTKEPKPRSAEAQSKDYYKSLFNYAAGNPLGMFGNVSAEQVARDPNLDAVRTGIREGQITDADTLQGYLENRGLQEDAQTPRSKGEHDNRTISKLINSGKKAEQPAKAEARRLRDRGKELGLQANEIKNMTLGALRASVDDLETQLGKKAPPKTTPKRKTGKKSEKAKVETQPKDTSPKPTEQKKPEDLKLHELEEALNEQTGNKARTNEVRKLKNKADQLESEILGLQKIRTEELGRGGNRTRAELRDMTTAQLEKYRNELQSNNKELLDKRAAEKKEQDEKIKTAQEKQKNIKINRAHNDGMGDILELGKPNTDGAIEALSKDDITALQKLFSRAVGDGKTSALRDKLTSSNVYGEKIDGIIKAAKNAHENELGRLKDAVDAFGKPLPKTSKSKILQGFLDYKAGDLSKTKFRDLVQKITRDETGKGIESRLIELAEQEKGQLADRLKALESKQEEAPRPKAVAPKKGAAKKESAPSRKLSQKTKTLNDKINEALGKNELSNSERANLDAAVRLAQEGDNAELNSVLKDLVDAESLTAAQAKNIRGIGQEKAAKPLDATKASIDELLKDQDENIDGELDPTQQVAQQQQLRLDNSYSDVNYLLETPLTRLANLVDKIWEKAESGKLTPVEAQAQIEVLKKDYDAQMNRNKLAETNTPERGATAIKNRLRQIKQANPGNQHVQRIVDFTTWLIDQNPDLVSKVNLALATDLRPGAGGKFTTGWDGGKRVLNIFLNADLDNVNTTTAVHEIIHASERMMPKELQDKLRMEYISRLLNKVKQVQRSGRLAEQDYLRDVLRYLSAPSKETYENAIQHIIQGKVSKKEFYKYFNSSEYWAEEASSILARRHRAENSWLPRVREWMNEFIERIKAVFGWDNNSAIYKGLREVMQTSGDVRTTRGLRDAGINADELPSFDITEVDDATRKNLDENGVEIVRPDDDDALYERSDAQAKAANEKLRNDVTKGWKNISWFQRAWENLAYAGYPLEQAKIALAKKGITLPFDTDPAEQLRLKDGRTSRNNDIDNNEVVRPVDDYLEKNWGKYADDKAEFVSKLNDFFGLTNLKERAHTAWLLNVKLTDGKGWTRDNIIEDVKEGTITPEAGRSKLESLVKKYADSTEKEYVENYIPDIDEYNDRLDSLKEDGIDQKSMAELNELLDNVRSRQRERLVEAGHVDDNDVWTRFYGWNWYVPLKGTSTLDADPRAQASFDIIPSDKLALAKLNSQYKAMEGRGTEGERPFERLFVDLARSGERAANGHFMRSLYELSLDNQKELGAYIYTLEGNPHDGYTDAKGNTFAKLPAPKDGLGFIVNDGDTHHVITYNAARKSGDNAASQIIRGLVVSNDILRPTGAVKSVARVTNTLARNYTTMSPTWQLFKGFVRDLTTIPVTMSVENFSGPVDAASFNARFVKELATSYDSLKVLVKQLDSGLQDKGIFASIDELATKNPDSYAGWVKRYLDNGGSNSFTQGFELDSISRNFTKSARNKAGIAANTNNSASERAAAAAGVALTPYTKWGELTSNWAQFLELIPRVAAFKAYSKTKGVSDAEAAVAVRRVMDYQQSGRWGRNINALLAFYRTGATGADVLRRAFRNPKTGKFDVAKAGKWATIMPVFGYIAYQVLAAALGDDEDGIEKIKKLRASTLSQYMVLPFTDEQGRPYGASIGLGLPQILLAPGALAAAVEAGHITEQEALAEYADTLRRNATPINREAVSMSLTATQPLIDLDRNRDSFDRPIHTEHEDKKKPRWQQGRQNTAPLYKDIAKLVYNSSDKVTAGMYQANMYPEDIRYLISSYGGQVVTDFMKKFVDAPSLEEGGIENTTNPLTSRAVIRDADYYDVERLYRLMDQYARVERRINNVTEGDAAAKRAYLEENPNLAEVIAAGKALQSARGKRDKAVKALRTDNNSLGRRAALRKQYDSSLREATNRLERALDKSW